MRRIFSATRLLIIATGLVIVLGPLGVHSAFASGVVGTGTPVSCTESAFDNALSGGGAVTFNCGASPVTITLSYIKAIAAPTTIDGGNKITLKAPSIYHFQVYAGQSLTLKNIKLTGGKHILAGSVENFGTFKAIHVTFQKNKGLDHGGAIVNYGTVNVKKSTFINNSAPNGGGAVYNDGGNVTIKTSTFQSNKTTTSGGAVANSDGDVTLVGDTFNNNSAADGGAVWAQTNSTNTISKSVLNGNKAASGAGVENFGGMQIINSTLSNNIATGDGGGIWQFGSLSVEKSSVSGNKAVNGAGMRDYGDSTFVDQSTFSGNQATQSGGGIYTNTNTGIQNSTFSGNSAGAGYGGGGLYEDGAYASFQYSTIANNSATFGGGVNAEGSSNSIIFFQNTVLSNNTGGNCDGATLTSNGYNLSSDTTCTGAFTETGDKNNKNAKLGPLANNGGPTLTHLPQAGSPLINKGLSDNHVSIDQRDFKRPVGASADIGAVEVQ